VKALHAYRDPTAVQRALRELQECARRRWTLMEVCGGQTHSLLESGLDQLLEPHVELLHGPGCPVCETPLETIDRAIELALRPQLTLCTFGDMLRVPGSDGDLMEARARGADVRVTYSPLDAARHAACHPERSVVFLAVGFETTVPAVAAATRWARSQSLENFFLLSAHVRVPPALEAICSAPDTHVEGFQAAGHVCAVMGTSEYEPIAQTHRIPIVVTGFETLDLVQGVTRAVTLLEQGEFPVEIAYRRAVVPGGNPAARALVEEVFEIRDRPWRGLGVLKAGGFALRPEWSAFDADRVFPPRVARAARAASGDCRASDVLRGALKPPQCPEFGTRCTPQRPLGAPMVSAEGACAAYFQFRAAARPQPRSPAAECTAVPRPRA